jgi:energy-coupling factor transport system permease protein
MNPATTQSTKTEISPPSTWPGHPVSLILTWIAFSIALQRLHPPTLWSAASVIMLAALWFSGKRFLQLLRRTRWIMLSLLLVYGYATPGDALWNISLPSPTWQGLLDGMQQLTRLWAMLAGLSLLLRFLTQQQLVAGLYALAWPLQWLGLSRERLVVRLALTVRYAETQIMQGGKNEWRAGLNEACAPQASDTGEIELPLYRFTLRDVILLFFALALLAWILL